MKFKDFLKDRWFIFLIDGVVIGFVTLMMLAFKLRTEIVIISVVMLVVALMLNLGIDFGRRKKFYDTLLNNAKRLDKGYYVSEMLPGPEFLEGRLVEEALYAINKSMAENVNKIETQQMDFKNYIEMWIHEVKAPLASLTLMLENLKVEKAMYQLKRVEDDVEQVLYYARGENAEKDYMVSKTPLRDVVRKVGMKNMNDLLAGEVEFVANEVNGEVYTDAKWLEFILGQLVNNSIKYKKDEGAEIKIYVEDDKDGNAHEKGEAPRDVTLVVEDNGIGISRSDLRQVFEKSFTGENGRVRAKSTGMGLFIAKNLCEKLGHKIEIESEKGKYTKVRITFRTNEFYEVVKD